MSNFIARSQIGSSGTRVAIKDVIDLTGFQTTAGCRALAQTVAPAEADAACLAGIRAAVAEGRAQIVGKLNLNELAAGVDGINQWYGTPTNPLDPELMPGGSSSGCAAAVGAGDADIAVGTDTGGSVRIPAACCGVTGLKTTAGRIPVEGVLPLSQSLDTVGPLARDIAGIVAGMQLLEPGFQPASDTATTIGRVQVRGVAPEIDLAIEAALVAAGFDIVPITLPGWETAAATAMTLSLAEAFRNWGPLIDEMPEAIGEATKATIMLGRGFLDSYQEAQQLQAEWVSELERAFEHTDLLSCPTLKDFPLPIGDTGKALGLLCTMQLNVAGLPALAQPVKTEGRLPASLQLFGPAGSEELLLSTGAAVEHAIGRAPSATNAGRSERTGTEGALSLFRGRR